MHLRPSRSSAIAAAVTFGMIVHTAGAARAPDRSSQLFARGVAQDTSWRAQLDFLARGSGVWITSNAAYRTETNGEAVSYAMRYWMDPGRMTQHGCLWGIDTAGATTVYWRFFTAWDPTRRQLFLHQSASDGTVGIGWETPGGPADQTFTRPDGTTWDVRHLNREIGPDVLETRSLERRSGSDWQPRRTYRWQRQPADPPAWRPDVLVIDFTNTRGRPSTSAASSQGRAFVSAPSPAMSRSRSMARRKGDGCASSGSAVFDGERLVGTMYIHVNADPADAPRRNWSMTRAR